MKLLIFIRETLDFLARLSGVFILGVLVLAAINILGPILLPIVLGHIALEILKA